MKYFNYLLIFIASFILFKTGFADPIKKDSDITFTNKEKQKYLGEYIINKEGKKEIRHIILKNDSFYYIVNEELQIPLKPESKTKFNLYPSATYLHFEFDSKGEIKKLIIKKGSGGILYGTKIK